MFDVMTQEGTTDHVVEQEERIFFSNSNNIFVETEHDSIV